MSYHLALTNTSNNLPSSMSYHLALATTSHNSPPSMNYYLTLTTTSNNLPNSMSYYLTLTTTSHNPPQSIRYHLYLLLAKCWASDACPILIQHWVNLSCLLNALIQRHQTFVAVILSTDNILRDPYNAEIFVYKPWRWKVFFNLKSS